MKSLVPLAFVVSAFLCSCNQNKSQKDNIPVVGGLDSSVIAQDTAMERSLESSYEYSKTLNISPKLAYDVRAYGGTASKGEYAIIRRGADNKPDTVVRARRFGFIVNSFAADLNRNGNEELYVVMRKTNPGAQSYVSAFELDKNGTARSLIFGDSGKYENINTQFALHSDSIPGVSDSIYVDEKEHELIKALDFHKKTAPAGEIQIYKLKGNKFVPARDAFE